MEHAQAFEFVFESWGRALSHAATEEIRLKIFHETAKEAVRVVDAGGLDKPAAVDRLLELAEAYGVTNDAGLENVEAIIGKAFEPPPEQPKTNGADAPHPNILPVQYAFPLNEAEIPPRDWAVPGLLMRRHVTVLVAPSGSGKSLLTIHMALAFADGQPWANWRPRGKLRCLLVNSEDDTDEMRRRFAASTRTISIAQELIADKVILAENPHGMIIAKFQASTKTLIRTPNFDQLVASINALQVDWLIVDPFAETFEGDENDNSELKWAGMLWREVARLTNTAVMLVHHTKKYATGMAGDVDAARGASALIGIARIVSTLFPMSKTEGETMGVKEDERHKFLRYDDAKANLNLKSPFAKWFQKKTITLGNARGDIPADEVGALLPWKPAGLMDGLSDDDITRFMLRVDQGLLDSHGVPTGEFYTFSTRKQSEHEMSRWIGELVMTFFKIKETKRAADMLKAWRSATPPRLVETEYYSTRQRKTRACVHSDLWTPPAGDNVVGLFDGKKSD